MSMLLSSFQLREVDATHGMSPGLLRRRQRSLEISVNVSIRSDFCGNIQCIDIDNSDQRYLLAGSSDGSVSIIDTNNGQGRPNYECGVIASVSRKSKHAHRFAVSCISWYPCDTGMFLSSGNDCILQIWDSNRLKPVEKFRFEKSIFQHHLSPVTSSKSLAAVATDSSNIFLVDLISGSTMQQLRSGHSDSVLSVQWSPRDENILVSGGADGRLLVWDVRSSKSLLAALKAKDLPPVKNKEKFSKNQAHTAGINGIRFTEDGLSLTSYGCDGYFRCWDAIRLRHQFSCTEKFSNDGRKFAQFSVSDGCAFVPTGEEIFLVDLAASGRVVKTLRGHYGKVNCCVYRSQYQDLFSGANDRSVLVWCPKMDQNIDYVNHVAPKALNELVEDAWSDNET